MENAITTVTPMALLQIAVQKSDLSIERMEQLLSLQIRWEENEARKAYHKAIADFKTESISILKNKRVGYSNSKGQFVGYSHATLGNIVQTIIPIMSKHGLSHYWEVRQENEISVTCKLLHSLGHSTSVTMSAGKDDSGQKNLIQQVASTVTYLERYTLLAITGLAAQDQDDDGACSGPPSANNNAHSGKPPVNTPQQKPPQDNGDKATEGQVKMLHVKIRQANITEAAFAAHYNIASVSDLPKSMVNAAIKAISDGEISAVIEAETDEKPETVPCKNCGEQINPVTNTGHLEGCTYAAA